ncbi:hypothetical protein NC651_002483 [Populus alba x Populus x berolinensis]|nr:hypothetical protein NC651_002483 [Populus alba x Populus x berolinensis]
MRVEKAAMEVEPRELMIAYVVLKKDMRGYVFQLNSIEMELCLAHDEMASLRQGMIEMRVS